MDGLSIIVYVCLIGLTILYFTERRRKIMKEKYPKFEKVNDHMIRIIMEHADKVPLHVIVQNREKMLQQKELIEKTLKDIDTVLENAKKLGITPDPKAMKQVPKGVPNPPQEG